MIVWFVYVLPAGKCEVYLKDNKMFGFLSENDIMSRRGAQLFWYGDVYSERVLAGSHIVVVRGGARAREMKPRA